MNSLAHTALLGIILALATIACAPAGEDPLPEARLANRMARVRAALYIENADQLF